MYVFFSVQDIGFLYPAKEKLPSKPFLQKQMIIAYVGFQEKLPFWGIKIAENWSKSLKIWRHR
jgi:hypothetical protein